MPQTCKKILDPGTLLDALFHSVPDALENAALVLHQDGSIIASTCLWRQRVQHLSAAEKNDYLSACRALSNGDADPVFLSEQKIGKTLVGHTPHADITLSGSNGHPDECTGISSPSPQSRLLLAQHGATGQMQLQTEPLTSRLTACETLLDTAAVMLITLNGKGGIEPASCYENPVVLTASKK